MVCNQSIKQAGEVFIICGNDGPIAGATKVSAIVFVLLYLIVRNSCSKIRGAGIEVQGGARIEGDHAVGAFFWRIHFQKRRTRPQLQKMARAPMLLGGPQMLGE